MLPGLRDEAVGEAHEQELATENDDHRVEEPRVADDVARGEGNEAGGQTHEDVEPHDLEGSGLLPGRVEVGLVALSRRLLRLRRLLAFLHLLLLLLRWVVGLNCGVTRSTRGCAAVPVCGRGFLLAVGVAEESDAGEVHPEVAARAVFDESAEEEPAVVEVQPGICDRVCVRDTFKFFAVSP